MDEELDSAQDESPEERRLLGELRRVAGLVDPVPGDLVEAARASLAWRRLDAELAELVADELTGVGTLAAVRGEPPSRLLRFTAGGVDIELEISVSGRGRSLLGQIEPPGPAAVTLRHADGSVSARADQYGRFSLPAVPAGPVSLRIEPATGPGPRVVETPWLST